MIKELFEFDEIIKNFKEKNSAKENIELLRKYIENIFENKNVPKIETEHNSNFIYVWNNYKNCKNYQKNYFIDEVKRLLLMSIANQEKSIEVGFDNCWKCGKAFVLKITEDKCEVLVENYEESDDCLKQTKFKTKIELKTGNLIIADYFRTKDNVLSKYVNPKDKRININYASGLLEDHNMYLSKNIIKVQVGNTCPSIYQKENSLVFKSSNEDKETSEYKGYVCTDLWAVTIMEKETLIDVLSQSEDTLEECLKNCIYTEVFVEKGLYECEFDIMNQSLSENDRETVYFTLTKIKDG